MELLTDKANCCGCSACANVCPAQCITMKPDEEGFLYPEVNESSCLVCGMCDRVCPLKNDNEPHKLLGVFGAQNKADEVRFVSSSGAIFSLLAEKVINNKGVVIGAELDKDFNVHHVMKDTLKGIEALRGSKYVQSNMELSMEWARRMLFCKRQVLFIGTPCQVAGLTSLLRTDDPNLLKVDVVCHGVPSPKVYRKYLAELEAEFGEPITKVKFRDKQKGWLRGQTIFASANHEAAASKRKDPYMRLFLNNVSIRPSCEDCHFNNKRSKADITIADFWGVNKEYPDFDDDKGTTLVLINTEKGLKAWEAIKAQVNFIETDFELAASYNQAVSKSLPLHKDRALFFNNLEQHTIKEWAEKLLD